jgi:hypothetical protein
MTAKWHDVVGRMPDAGCRLHSNHIMLSIAPLYGSKLTEGIELQDNI